MLIETEEVYLAPYARQVKTKKAAAATLNHLDFLVERGHGGKTTPIFHVELKAGPSSVEEMTQFQLDINDSNDIVGVANNTGLPVYIFHARLDHEYRGPTRRTVAGGMWWTDIFTLLENRVAVRDRRGEEKKAGYYSPRAFRSMEAFINDLGDKRYLQLARRLKEKPLELT